MDILNYRIENVPSTIYYIPNFISDEEEHHILSKVYSVPKPKWTCLSNRRLQDYGGVPHKKGMIVEKIPTWLQIYLDKINNLKIFVNKANHVLVNEYLPGQGIMAHSDGPIFSSLITTISCGSHTVLEFVNNTEQREKICSLLLERCSLVIVKDDMYNKYLHSINEVTEDTIDESIVNLKYCDSKFSIGSIFKRTTRISLTIRNVPKVCKLRL